MLDEDEADEDKCRIRCWPLIEEDGQMKWPPCDCCGGGELCPVHCWPTFDGGIVADEQLPPSTVAAFIKIWPAAE